MQARCSRSALLACTALAVLSLSTSAVAQGAANGGNGETTTLKAIVVKGKRVKTVGTGVDDTPLASTVTAEQLENKQVTSIEDLGRSLEPGVSFNRSNGSVNIRGLEGSRVLTTIDGLPVTYLSDATRDASGGLNSFDFGSLSQADVVRGGDSSRAGSGALGGVLALRTLEPEDLIAEGRTWGGLAKITYDSAERSFNTNAVIASQFDNTSVLFQGGYKKGHERQSNGTVDTYGATRTKADPADFAQHNLLFKVRHYAESGHMFGVTLERYRRDTDSDPRSILGASSGTYRAGYYDAFNNTDRDRVSLDYAYEAQEEGSLIDTAAASIYWQKQLRGIGYDSYRFASPIGDFNRFNTLEEENYGFIGTASKVVDNHKLTFGWDFATGTTTQYAAGKDTCPASPPPFHPCLNLHANQADSPKVDGTRIGLFVEDKIAIGSTGSSVTPGVRFDWVSYDPKMTPEFSDNYNNPALPGSFEDTAISPKLRFAHEVNDNLELYAQWAMGFRAPTAGELYSIFGGKGTYLRLGNPDLESEMSNSFDIGVNWGDNDLGGRVNLFYSRYKNFIDIKKLTALEATALGYDLNDYIQGGITRGVNLDRARIYGAELSAHKRFDNGFGIRGSLAYADGKDMSTGDFLRSVLPLKGVLGLDYDAGNWGVGIDWIGARGGKGKDVVTTGGRPSREYFATPGYGIVDLTARWEPEQLPGLKINAGIYNVFDKTYYDYATARMAGTQPNPFYSEPGRTFRISLTQKF